MNVAQGQSDLREAAGIYLGLASFAVVGLAFCVDLLTYADVWILALDQTIKTLPLCALWAGLVFLTWRALGRRAWWVLFGAPIMFVYFLRAMWSVPFIVEGFLGSL